MTYNLFIKHSWGGFNLLDLHEDKLSIILNTYKNGDYKFTIKGKEYNWGDLNELRIFRNESSLTSKKIEDYAHERGGWIRVFGGDDLISEEFLERLGPEVTEEYIQDHPFGYGKTTSVQNEDYVNESRISELAALKIPEYDLSKLVQILYELNNNWHAGNYFTVGLLLRTLINHVPPLFGPYQSFKEVIADTGSHHFKRNMEQLNTSMRAIADSYTHDLVRKKEALPNRQQTDFRANVDVLLAEIIKKYG